MNLKQSMMKDKYFFVILVSLTLFCSCAPEKTDQIIGFECYICNKGGANIYNDSKCTKYRGHVDYCQDLTVLEIEDDFVKVSYKNNGFKKSGWCMVKYIATNPENLVHFAKDALDDKKYVEELINNMCQIDWDREHYNKFLCEVVKYAYESNMGAENIQRVFDYVHDHTSIRDIKEYEKDCPLVTLVECGHMDLFNTYYSQIDSDMYDGIIFCMVPIFEAAVKTNNKELVKLILINRITSKVKSLASYVKEDTDKDIVDLLNSSLNPEDFKEQIEKIIKSDKQEKEAQIDELHENSQIEDDGHTYTFDLPRWFLYARCECTAYGVDGKEYSISLGENVTIEKETFYYETVGNKEFPIYLIRMYNGKTAVISSRHLANCFEKENDYALYMTTCADGSNFIFYKTVVYTKVHGAKEVHFVQDKLYYYPSVGMRVRNDDYPASAIYLDILNGNSENNLEHYTVENDELIFTYAETVDKW
ncbi:hypothetical protein [Treponema sp.]|uniref:hypothetical protein n=1 Tax=Treponema sp. TaxID=166 RepID=UPI00298E16C3|nr:hypothetical protein [Treponema sp.]MCR5613910.1 hypothetical protein [Treponema sp.]